MSTQTKTRTESNPGVGLPVPFATEIKSSEMKVHEPAVQNTPYVVFVSTKGSAFAGHKDHIANLEDGDPVLVMPDGERVHLAGRFKFYLVFATQYWAHVSNDGAIIRATFDGAEADGDKDLGEHVDTMLLVPNPVNGQLVPARCTFKTTKTNAAHSALATMKKAENADMEWYNKSAEHKATLAIPLVRHRFISEVSLKRGFGKHAYVAANSKQRPVTIAEWNAAKAYLDEVAKTGPANVIANKVVEKYKARIAEVKRHCQ